MKYKATTTFAGRVTMRAGEVQDLDKDLAEPLLKSGYLEPVEKAEEEPAADKPVEKAEEEPAADKPVEKAEEEPVADKDEVKEKESERTDAGSDLQSPSGTAGESKSRRRKSD